jgi:predicted nucleotide-binding protein
MPLSNVERDICKFVVRRFLDQNEATPRRILLKEFKASLPEAARKLVDRWVLKVVDHTNETYLPRAIAFHYCGDPVALTLAKRSMETVLRVLRNFYEQELEKEPQDQKRFTPADVETEARKFDPDFDEKMTDIGLYLTEELGIFYTLQWDEKQVFVKHIRPSERVYEATKVSNPWDLLVEQGRVSVERAWEDRQSKASPVTVPSDKDNFDALTSFMNPSKAHDDQEISRKVFLVHGHDEAVQQTVSKFLNSLNLDVVILHEQPNQGRTIIEKFEKHSDVGFAVVLLTPDDVGAAINHPANAKKRARQNVILELGYFIGKLGRGRVCPIYIEEVELPSDLHGVLWVAYDQSGEWRSKLAREIHAAGIDVDLGKVTKGA